MSLTIVKLVAGVVPKSTWVAPRKPAPLIVTRVPPADGPDVGVMFETSGAYVKWSPGGEIGEVPPGVVTRTSTALMPAGLVAMIEVSFTTVKFVDGLGPKSTAVAQ